MSIEFRMKMNDNYVNVNDITNRYHLRGNFIDWMKSNKNIFDSYSNIYGKNPVHKYKEDYYVDKMVIFNWLSAIGRADLGLKVVNAIDEYKRDYEENIRSNYSEKSVHKK